MFAVIKSGGRQYKVSVGQTLEVNRLAVEDGAQVTFDEVLLIADEDTSMVGAPYVDNAQVLATAVKQARGEKLIIFKYKAKKRYRHKRGHRQELTVLMIDDIVAEGKSLITGAAPTTRETPTENIEENDEMVTPTEETPSTTDETTTSPADTDSSGGTRRRRTVKAEDTETEDETEE
ncbi:MAG TPA: 50S ribosomal protein L21 [Ktedonobacteraceae bacterium]|nr:50S ribosomal protein L21 [Ktedonobacteraceae bacterium]